MEESAEVGHNDKATCRASSLTDCLRHEPRGAHLVEGIPLNELGCHRDCLLGKLRAGPLQHLGGVATRVLREFGSQQSDFKWLPREHGARTKLANRAEESKRGCA